MTYLSSSELFALNQLSNRFKIKREGYFQDGWTLRSIKYSSNDYWFCRICGDQLSDILNTNSIFEEMILHGRQHLKEFGLVSFL